MSEQWLTSTELMRVRSIVGAFNNVKDMGLDDCALSDINGEKLGTIVYRDGEYVFAYSAPV